MTELVRTSTSGFNLEQTVSLLEHPVDILSLHIIELDRFLVLVIPQREVFKPNCDTRVIGHTTEMLILIFIQRNIRLIRIIMVK